MSRFNFVAAAAVTTAAIAVVGVSANAPSVDDDTITAATVGITEVSSPEAGLNRIGRDEPAATVSCFDWWLAYYLCVAHPDTRSCVVPDCPDPFVQ